MWKHFIADYLSFTKKERTGIFVLLSLIAIFIALPFFYPLLITQKIYDHTAFEKAIDSLKIKQADRPGQYVKHNQSNYNEPAAREYGAPAYKSEMFFFDPNAATAADWKRLGIRDKTILTIQKYLSKGGKFYKKEDIGKIWGLHNDEVKRLMPYVQIKNANGISKYAVEKVYGQQEFKPKTKVIDAIDINLADTAALIILPGIGSKLSQRIINFRDKLGGFYRVDQIGETYGLPDSTFQKIKSLLVVRDNQLKKININVASVDEMKTHPYLRYGLANAIVQYRLAHGRYVEVSDVKKIMTLTEDIYIKVAPYLSVD